MVEEADEGEAGLLHSGWKDQLLLLRQEGMSSSKKRPMPHPVEMDRTRIVEVLILRSE